MKVEELRIGQLVVARHTLDPVLQIRKLEMLSTGKVRVTGHYVDLDLGIYVERRYLAHRVDLAPEGSALTTYGDEPSAEWAEELFTTPHGLAVVRQARTRLMKSELNVVAAERLGMGDG